MCYTSGTTGLPKGAMLTHGNVLANAHFRVLADDYGQNTRLYLPAPLAFTGTLATWAFAYVGGGYVSGLRMDPIEKKPFFHVLPGAATLSFGMLGCNFSCQFCQNWLTSQVLRDPQAEAVVRECTPQSVVAQAKAGRAKVVVSTYNEPLITSEWAAAIFDEARSRGLALRLCLQRPRHPPGAGVPAAAPGPLQGRPQVLRPRQVPRHDRRGHAPRPTQHRGPSPGNMEIIGILFGSAQHSGTEARTSGVAGDPS